MNKNILLDTIRAFGGQPKTITIHRAFVEFTRSLEAGMMLSQLLYWSERDGGRGRVAKTDADWMNELCLTQYAVRQARKALEDMGILRTEVHRFNGVPTVHYFLLEDVLSAKWELWIQKNVLAKSKERSCEFAKSLTESTTESTTESENSPNGESTTIEEEIDIKQEAISKGEFIKIYAPRLAEILCHSQTTATDRAAARKLAGMRFERQWLDTRLRHYADRAEFQKPGANAYWIVNRLEDDWAKRDRNSRAEQNTRAALEAARAR